MADTSYNNEGRNDNAAKMIAIVALMIAIIALGWAIKADRRAGDAAKTNSSTVQSFKTSDTDS